MPHTLVIAASALGDTARSTRLAREFIDMLSSAGDIGEENSTVKRLALVPPPPLAPQFVAGAFTPPDHRSEAMHEALEYSNGEIESLRCADRIVISTPMYNFGMPGLLKSWFDQIVRPGETFETTGDAQEPYRGLLAPRPCLVITTRGSDAFSPSGPAQALNMLDRHLTALLNLIGLTSIDFIDSSGLDEGNRDEGDILAETRAALAALARRPNWIGR